MISSSEVASNKPWQNIGSPPTGFRPKKPFIMPRLVRAKNPDHVIGYGSTFQGRFGFRGLLRVEGRFEGVLKPEGSANVVVSRSGVVVGDLEGCHSVVVEGTVIGNISANVVDLRRNAHVEGNVWCKELAAASTAVFRNRSSLASSVPTSNSSSRRRSGSTSSASPSSSLDANDGGSGKVLDAVGMAANGNGSSSVNSGNGIPTSRGSSEEHLAATTSPPSSGPPSLAGTASLTPASPFSAAVGLGTVSGGGGGSNGNLSRAAFAAAMPGSTFATAAPRTPDAIGVAVGAAFSVSPTASPTAAAPLPANGGDTGAGNLGSFGGRSSHEQGAAMAVRGVGVGGVPSFRSYYNSNAPPVGNVYGNLHLGNGHVLAAPVPMGGGKDMAAPPETPPPPPLPHPHGNGSGNSSVNGGSVSSSNGSGHTDSPPRSGGLAMGQRPFSAPAPFPRASARRGGCPLPHDIRVAMEKRHRKDAERGRNEARAQSDAWRDSAKEYGVKATSLTRVFASVAMLLQFDGGLFFEEHLQMEYAAENLWFWKRAMKYRSSPFHCMGERREEASAIYEAFLSVDAADQVNISHDDRENVRAALEGRPGAQAIGAGLFDEALIQVENMLALGPFPRFASSTVKNIEKSWTMVVDSFSIEDAGESFYSVLFEVAPSVEGLFTRSKRVQGEMLMSIVDSSVKLLNNLEELVPILIQLGLRHNAYKVRAEHFPIVGEALVATLSLALGKGFTPEMRQSWVAVYALMSNIMISVLDPPPPDEEPVGSMVETSSISSEFGSRESSEAFAALGSGDGASSSGRGRSVAGMSSRGEGSGSVGGVGGITASARGMYRRGTNSFRNHLSKFVRKESMLSSTAPVSTTTTATPLSSTSSCFAMEALGGTSSSGSSGKPLGGGVANSVRGRWA